MAQNTFEKINEYVEASKRCVALEREIASQLDKWFNEHKSELEEYFHPHLVSFCRHRSSWWYDNENEVIRMVLNIGLGEDSHFDKINVYPDGHWEKYKEKLFQSTSRRTLGKI